MLIDSHCHLNHLRLDDGLTIEKVVQNAKSKGINKIISISTTLEEVQTIADTASAFQNVYYSVGVHPSETEGVQPVDAQTIIDYIDADKAHKCVAIGETGLDYFYNEPKSYQLQKQKFIAHVEAAKILKKPVIVHTRAAKEDTLSILKDYNIECCGGVLHCFTEDWDMANQALNMGMYISISGIVTFKNAQDVQEMAKKIPLDRLLVETDAPYLTPIPYRGKPNYPEYVYYVAEFLAKLRGEDFEEFCIVTKANTMKLFQI
ncbi:TatD family hydrolase [Fastidiosibacter lacustris]|uniref:TatD family hydrolase n=1 Tax=Fastidiosibacter lacustris TaxID=2056695 RepID=UPI000E341016|nr:TatD family hydrolase [Fastidiosibacter lacustris]